MLLALAILVPGFCGRCADVVIDRSQTFQTIEGWGLGGGILGGTQGAYGMLGPAIADPVNYQYLDKRIEERLAR